MSDEWLDLPEAAARLQRHPTLVRKLVADGTLIAQRLGPTGRGGRWMVSAASVAALAAQWAAQPPRRGRPADAEPSPGALATRRSRAKHQE